MDSLSLSLLFMHWFLRAGCHGGLVRQDLECVRVLLVTAAGIRYGQYGICCDMTSWKHFILIFPFSSTYISLHHLLLLPFFFSIYFWIPSCLCSHFIYFILLKEKSMNF